jgi:hypothetical protein
MHRGNRSLPNVAPIAVPVDGEYGAARLGRLHPNPHHDVAQRRALDEQGVQAVAVLRSELVDGVRVKDARYRVLEYRVQVTARAHGRAQNSCSGVLGDWGFVSSKPYEGTGKDRASVRCAQSFCVPPYGCLEQPAKEENHMNDELLEMIEHEVLSWPGVGKQMGGGGRAQGGFWVPPATVYRFGSRQIGHIHTTGVADLTFPREIHDELISDGRAKPHPAGFANVVSHHIREPEDVPKVLELFRMSYERAKVSAERRRERTERRYSNDGRVKEAPNH